MKKIIATITIVMLVVLSVLSASAATQINTDEQKVLDALSGSITTSDGSVTIPDSYINQVKQYLLAKEIDATEATTILAKINEAKTVTKTVPGTSFTKVYDNMTSATKNNVIGIAQDAADVAGATLTVNATAKTVTIADSEAGTFVFDLNAIKKTGVSGNAVMAGIASVLLLGAVSYVIFASRKIALGK
ncbi:MAG: hypothetical protein PHV07_05150 [Oscillospiraceae bacterium]|nr:hypothetical protein [Tissierellia bacterium]MDD4699633.1 hypothetical protein [Oscillospiraceae bacterium]